ncbi:MAG: deoxyguanosinetriphosphate triphosphohydrolase, partial [Actinobacteria bacterium]|nr:deoxyguanosinetriphosphate triphosphohydrolase [Actinomycetota bacterium]
MEAQIMDWSDDVAYSVHDLEDGLVTGQIDISKLNDDLEHLYQTAIRDYLPDLSEQEAKSALNSLHNLSCWPKEFDRSHRHLAQLKDLTSQLIGRFALYAERATRERYGDGNLTRYQANLIVPREVRIEVAILKSIAGYYIIGAEVSKERYARQEEVIIELVEAVSRLAPASLESFFLQQWQVAESAAAKMRVVIDQVASLTDMGAYALHEKLIGA